MSKSWYLTPKQLNDNTEELKELTSSYDSAVSSLNIFQVKKKIDDLYDVNIPIFDYSVDIF